MKLAGDERLPWKMELRRAKSGLGAARRNYAEHRTNSWMGNVGRRILTEVKSAAQKSFSLRI
jgi:hypothetical protein